MGPTGCGKTSLISLIPRFSDVSGGTVSVDGTPVGMYDLKKLRGSVGIATQDVFLFSDTVDGNIAYGDPEMSEDDVKRFAKIACVDFVDKLPEGFDTVIGERGTGLSGGQKQRIALARALPLSRLFSFWTTPPPPWIWRPKNIFKTSLRTLISTVRRSLSRSVFPPRSAQTAS